MRAVWEEEKRLEYYLKVEAALARALAGLGKIPAEAADAIEAKANTSDVRLGRVREIEAETKHDVMAVVKALSEQCGEAGKYVHLTATSYDIVDTAQAIQLREALQIILRKGRALLAALLESAQKHEGLVMVGRTHGQHALPITLGFKLANYAEKLGSGVANLEWDAQHLVQGKFSGAVGTYSAQKIAGTQGTQLEELIMQELGLAPAPISTQVVGRENIARILCDVAILAGTLEQVAKEVRNLQRTEIAEVSEPFAAGQVGSSTMAQKKNPWESENVCSNARVVRSCILPALEDIALEHERDLTNSAAERSVLPTAFLLVDDMLDRMKKIVSGLVVFPENMRRNLELTGGAIMAEAVITELVKKGIGRQEAHEVLRTASHEAMSKGHKLKNVLLENEMLSGRLSAGEMDVLFDYDAYTGQAVGKTREVVAKWSGYLRERQ